MRCTSCGGALRPDGAWCGLCHAAAAPAAAPRAVAPPAGAPPAGAPPGPAPGARARRAGLLAGGAIALGAGLSSVTTVLLGDGGHEVEALVRYAFVDALVTYALVGWLVVAALGRDGGPLRWRGSWHPAAGAATGLVAGGTLGAGVVALIASSGAEGGDARMALLVSEGDLPHVLAAFLVVCVGAPVVEELLFRGVLLASWEPYGTRLALAASAFAFALWHLDLDTAQLAYYTLCGGLLGFVYLRQGLVASMTAHAAFNGTLLAAAVSFALAPGAVLAADGVRIQAPAGWHASGGGDFLYGPSGAVVETDAVSGAYAGVTVADLAERVREGSVAEIALVDVREETVRAVDLPGGAAVRASFTLTGRAGEAVLIPHGDDVRFVFLRSGGSRRAHDDFEAMLATLRVTGAR